MQTKRISIKWKIFLYLIGFCCLLLIILWLFQTVLLEQFYKVVKIRDIEKEASVISQYILDEDWEGLVNTVTVRGDLYVEVWNEQLGRILYTGNYPEGIQAQLTQSFKLLLYQEAAASGNSDIKHFINKNAIKGPQESILLYQMVWSGEGSGQLLMVSANITPVSATVDTLRIQLVYISGIMLALSVGLAFLISRRVSRPIERLNDSARELGSGNTNVRFYGDGYREIAELADNLTQAAAELGKTEQLRQELIANVSHDLRTPLTLITGYGEMIRDLPDENTPENMQVIIDESKRLTSLVSDLLDLSRLQSGVQPLQITRYNLTQGTRAIIGRFAKFCEQEGYIILFEQDEDVWVEADTERIAQVVYNFLINSIHHTGPDKTVTVRQITAGSRVTLQVADTGEGIPAEDLPNIWNRYYKVDKVHKRAATGTGLGLSIVKSVLEQHPGVEYGVRSTVGEGSTFWFSLERV